jgi:hypothetical protein
MAVSKTTRSNPAAQRQRRRRNIQTNNPHLKAELLDTLRQINRGYGVALAALGRLHKPGIFPHDCLSNYRNRTEALRALANRDLLRLFAGHEEHDAERFENAPHHAAGAVPAPRRKRLQ